MSKRGKKYTEAQELIGADEYSLADAVDKVIETSKTSFDSSVELHMALGIDPSKGDQLVRGTVTLPHGTGKKLRIAAFVPQDKVKEAEDAGAALVGSEELIDKIQKSGKCDFDIAVATPDMMRFLGKVAKILGPKGLMPNPKNETVTPDPANVIKELSQGKVSFRNDDGGNMHQVIGKVSFGKDALLENAEAYLAIIKKNKPSSSKGVFLKKVVLCSSMGPSVRVKI
ncbi:50S ribosomal protein L1 [Patescibacteria group bacterium]|nr:50S ribosomal protein L1 [Patescibacteria group bacterium]